MDWTRGLSKLAMLAALAAGTADAAHAYAASVRPASVGAAIQVLADLTAIDADCQGLQVNFGIGFLFASEQGLSPASIMPTGSHRPAFETALRLRQDDDGPPVVCGNLARHYSIALPGSVTFQPPGRDGS